MIPAYGRKWIDDMWRYEQSTGKLFDPSNIHIYTGYAGGNCGENPEGINNSNLQGVKCVGPLPTGKYTMGEVVLKSHLGPFAIPLIPFPENKMYGRGDFYIHGDTSKPRMASEGCIIMPHIVRVRMAGSPDRIVEVF
jgi:Protein of unknown function (DUF2778)